MLKGRKIIIRTGWPGAALLFLVAPLLLTACNSSGSTNTPGSPTSTSVAQATRAPSPTATPRPHYTVGEQVPVGASWLVTLTSVTPSSGDSAYQPQTGNNYLVLEVTQQNRASQPLAVNSQTEWVLHDSAGHSYALVTTDYGEPPTGTIAAGDAQQGQLVYEVPSSEHQFTLTFTPSGGSEQATWDIQV